MRAPVLGIFCVAVASAACGEECPVGAIEVRLFSGTSVESTQITCAGDGVRNWPACYYTTNSQAVRAGTEWTLGCGEVGIALGGYIPMADNVQILLTGDEAVEEAAALSIAFSDQEGSPPPVPARVLDGYVAIQQYSHDGRNRGRFEIVFEEGTISGTYDADFLSSSDRAATGGSEGCAQPVVE